MQSQSDAELQQRVLELEQQVAELRAREQARIPAVTLRGVRRRSATTILGLPLVDIATGPDPSRGEVRGHAKGIIAIGDKATGVLAIGGVACGLISIGGVAIGGLTLGGVSLGILFGLGGVATGALAIGGAAIGYVAIGGAAIGVYAAGGGAVGQHVINGMQQDPEAVSFFTQWFPWVQQLKAGR
ncbi:MAG: hypothetical protein KDA85_19240 [Planctomycetaceae bacterium]|nr:hypothetical protein [Planctomycetaceae bacterium]